LELTDRTDEQLAAMAAREGSDGPAFVALMARFRDRVWRTCYRLMGNAEDANDAAQEVFVRLFLHRDRFAGRSRYSTFVHGVALRTCLAMRRARSRRERRVTLGDTSLAAGGSEPASGLRLDLMKMLETLDEEDRAMMILKHAEGHSYEELAELFNLSESACKMRLSRAREKLKQRYPELGE
jgi:RNA polymerase sigma-70 factor (ECF subfamily)